MRIDFVEPGGRGGVYQHTVGVAHELASAGHSVTLHTADDAELRPPLPVMWCPCIRWRRGSRLPAVTRKARMVGDFIGRVGAHLRKAAEESDVVHVQGVFALNVLVLRRVKGSGALIAFSPHNTFARSGNRIARRSLRWMLRSADVVFTFSDHDLVVVQRLGCRAVRVPLTQWVPPPDEATVSSWRKILRQGSDDPVALLPGQVRADKRPADFLRAVARVPGLRAAVVGEDLGAADGLEELARELRVVLTLRLGYLTLDDFVAAIAAADVIVTPYSQASQSGVLAVAAQLSVPSVCTPVGGLGDLATCVALSARPDHVAEAIELALAQVPARGTCSRPHLANIYQDSYRLARRPI